MKNNYYKKLGNGIFLTLTLVLAAFTLAFTISDGGGKKTLHKSTLKAGDAYRLFINNINMPMNNEGVIANVNIDGTEGGMIDGKTFLFSGGFFLSGISNGTMFANAVASASRIQDYEPGTSTLVRDPRAVLYVLRQSDGPFAESWEEWRDAVALGAYFHDGDGDGVYNPADLNGNGKWDPSEDRPDLIGDETVWCVYTDSKDPAQREFNDVDPQGIDIGQTVFAFRSKGITGNMIFVRYSLLNTGTVADTIKDAYFGVWADPDLGNPNDAYLDDLVGTDTTTNSGYTYNSGDDAEWGLNPPCFLIDFFQGPIVYVPGETFIDMDGSGDYTPNVDEPLDTAYNVQGQQRGREVFPGAKNLGLSSFVHYMQSHVTQGDPDNRNEARNYMLGLNRVGDPIDPCTWTFGEVRGGVPCAEVDNKYMYSGDPVTDVGWINIFETDQRQMSNTGPFELVEGQPVDIVVAYVVGIGDGPLDAITVAKFYDETAQVIFDNNFPSPPAPPGVILSSQNGSDFLDLDFDTPDQVTYNAVDTVLDIDRRLQGYYVTAYLTNSKAGTVNGINNSVEIARYEMDNAIKSVYQIAPNGGQNLIIPEVDSLFKLDSLLYSDIEQGRIKLRLEADPFTGLALIKGHEYYFAVTGYYLNHKVIVNRETGTYGPEGDYYDPTGGALEEFDIPILTVTFGEDLLSPSSRGIEATGSTLAPGAVKYMIVNSEELTGDDYKVEFFRDSSQAPGEDYTPFWRLTNMGSNSVLVDSSSTFNFDTTNYSGIVNEGFVIRVQQVAAEFEDEDVMYVPESNDWFTRFRTDSSTGIYYVGRDIPQGSNFIIGGNNNARSDYISADRLRTVEIRFGENGKAYRYLNGFVGTPITRRSNYVYGGGVTAADTGGTKGSVGLLGEGYVDVPFTVWSIDPKYDVNAENMIEERQLAVGFVEFSQDLLGNADGLWDPGTVASQLGNESIIIFDADYDSTGSQIQYTGNIDKWADVIKGFDLTDPSATPDQIDIAKSKWFNALYVVGLKRESSTAFYQPGDKLTIPVVTYPYNNGDEYSFSTTFKGELPESQNKALWESVNVFPNPLFGYNPATSYSPTGSPDRPFVTFSNLPVEVTIRIYTLSGTLIRTLRTADKSSPTSNFLRWDLENEQGLRAASGLYIAVVETPKYGAKVLKFSIIMPQKQIERF